MHQIDNVLISDNVWNTNFACDLTQCKGVCCQIGDMGAPIGKAEKQIIINNLSNLESILSKKNIQFLKTGVTERYRGDLHIREMGKNQSCPLSFVSKSGTTLCSLHNLAIEDNIPLLKLKPVWCSLFPLILKKTKTDWIINMHIPDFCRSVPDAPSLLISFEDELTQIFGEEWMGKVKREYDKQ